MSPHQQTILPCHLSSRPHNPPALLTLPPELRIQIYHYLLVPGRIFFSPLRQIDYTSPRYHAWQSYPIPTLSLLRVCRLIHAEAEYEYATHNVFVIPADFQFQRPCLPHHRPLMSRRAWSYVRAISVSYHNGATPLCEMLPDTDVAYWTRNWTGVHGEVVDGRWGQRNRRGRTVETHNLMTTFCLNKMVERTRDLYELLPKEERLRVLEVDVASAFCPMADHRLVEYVGRYLTYLSLPGRVDVFGAWSTEEMVQFATEVHKSMLWFQGRRFCLHFHTLNTAMTGRIGERNCGAVYHYQFEGNSEDKSCWSGLEGTPACYGKHDANMRLNVDGAFVPLKMLESIYYPEAVLPEHWHE